MSAWYVFSALGFYPDLPAGDDYAVGTPRFPRATLALPGGTLTIEAPRSAEAAIYVRAATLDGRSVGQRLRHADIVGGGALRFELSDAP